MKRLLLILVLAVLTVETSPRLALGQGYSVLNSAHNLSAGGPGAIRATGEEQVCIFCHTPHNASPIQPLWNRNLPVSAYIPYSSSSLQAKPGQPTGTSKLCLSCHDGTIALGSVVSRRQPIQMAGGMTTLPPGHKANLGTDLSDDHPISFRYDQALAAKNLKLVDPASLSPATRLDAMQELQCTTCHDAHDNTNGNFLVMNNANSQLCNACHRQGSTEVTGHLQCAGCHQTHTAPSGPYLLRGATAKETCGQCHAGQPGPDQGPNVIAELAKMSRHDNPSDEVTLTQVAATTVDCHDCHEPHTMGKGSAPAPNVPPNLGAISGFTSAGAFTPRAQFGYQVCYKCHSVNAQGNPTVSRQLVQLDTHLEFSPNAVSFHPVEVAGKNLNVPSLRPGMNVASIIACTDCHASDTSVAAGGAGAAGPHGSNVSPLLLAPYETADNTTETSVTYALCYRCHDRSSILGNQSFQGHSSHVVDQRTPCSACHDSHGVSSVQGTPTNNAHLMNFDITIVQRDTVTGLLEYRTNGPGSAICYLNCHGVAHSPKSYTGAGLGAAPVPAARILRKR